jgi:hypothetical protein
MSRTEAELRAQLKRASQMHFGEGQTSAMEDVVARADAGGHRRLAFDARRRLANAYCVDRQWDKAFPLFSRCLSDHDRRPGDFSPEEELELREWYAFIVTTMAEFPEVTMDQIRGAQDDVERRFRAGGHSLREVYSARRWVAQLTGDWDEEERCYRLWQAAGGPRPGDVWEFEAEVERLVLRGDEASLARARQLTAPVLAGQVSFTSPSIPIQCLMLMPLARAGELDLAAAAYRQARREQFRGQRQYRYEYSAMLHEFCALTGNEYQGLADLKLRVHGFWTLNRPNGKMEYAASVALLCRSLAAVGGGNSTVSGAEEGREIFTGVLAEEARRIALDLAARFDYRNGNTWQGDRIRARLAAAPVTDTLALTPGATPRLRLPPVAPGMPARQLAERAEWHLVREEFGAGWQYLAALADLGDPPPELAAPVAYLRARLTWGKQPDVEAWLRRAAEAYLRAGDQLRHLFVLCWLGEWHRAYGDAAQAGAILEDAMPRLRHAGNPRALATPEWLYALWLRGTGRRKEALTVLKSALQHGESLGDALIIGRIGLTVVRWRHESEPGSVFKEEAILAKDFFLRAEAPVLAVAALEELRRAHAKAGTPGEFDALVAAELNRLPPDTAPLLLGYLRIRRGLGLVAAGRAAEAVDDLAWGVAEARTREADTASQVFYLAVALHAAGRPAEAAAELGGTIRWLDNLRGLGHLTEPDMPERARALLAECRQQAG